MVTSNKKTSRISPSKAEQFQLEYFLEGYAKEEGSPAAMRVFAYMCGSPFLTEAVADTLSAHPLADWAIEAAAQGKSKAASGTLLAAAPETVVAVLLDALGDGVFADMLMTAWNATPWDSFESRVEAVLAQSVSDFLAYVYAAQTGVKEIVDS